MLDLSKPQETLVSTAQSVLRGWLIEHFVNEQKATHKYLLLTEDRGPSRRVPSSLVVAEQWAWLRQKAGTVPEEVQKAEIDLMHAVSAGMFPELLMIHRTTSVELLPCFDRSFVEELAAKIGRNLEIEFNPWEAENKNTEPGTVTINTSVMTPEKCASMRPRNLGLLLGTDDLFVVGQFRGMLWAPRTDVVSFLEDCGIAAKLLPPSWQTHSGKENDLSDAPQDAPDYVVMERRGNGKIHNSVFDAMEEKWSDHHVPKSLTIKAIEREIKKGLQQRGVNTAEDHIRRIIGKKK
jgi:hypothetical protein